MIGSHLCEYLSGKGELVYSLDIKTGFDLRNMPLDDYSDYDYVWFFAWDVGGAKYIMNYDNSFKLLDNNLKICTNVFNFLK